MNSSPPDAPPLPPGFAWYYAAFGTSTSHDHYVVTLDGQYSSTWVVSARARINDGGWVATVGRYRDSGSHFTIAPTKELALAWAARWVHQHADAIRPEVAEVIATKRANGMGAMSTWKSNPQAASSRTTNAQEENHGRQQGAA
jgi:hypothetical protein